MADTFRYHSTNITERQVELTSPKVNRLEVKTARENWIYGRRNFLHFEPFPGLDNDTAYINHLQLRFMKSSNDSFHVTYAKMASGKNPAEANATAEKIEYTITQEDSTLLLPKGIKIDRANKYRNQAVYVTVYVPVGKRIYVDDNIWNDNFDFHFGWEDDWRYRDDFYDEGQSADNNVEYVMMASGRLKRTHPRMENDDNNDGDNNGNTEQPNSSEKTDSTRYHYNPKTPKAPARPAAPKKDSVSAKQAQTKQAAAHVTAIPAMIIERFTI
jgi:hypothetical protein